MHFPEGLMPPHVHIDDALNYLIQHLAKTPEPGIGEAHAREQRAHGSDIWIATVSTAYWHNRERTINQMSQDEKESYLAPFYDAAWELCRRGVLRPAAAMPDGQSSASHIGPRVNAAPFFGDGYSLTAWGREWVQKAASEHGVMPTDPSRISEVLSQFQSLFGDGYAQRAAEAVSDWRTMNYLSACTMAGAAAESILIAVVIAKTRDEKKVLSEYQSSRGRNRVIKRVIAGSTSVVGERFNNALGILSFWRDEAGHGIASNIGEIEAHEAISRLLRLARFTSDNWAALTAPRDSVD
jgi:hypothetical protein